MEIRLTGLQARIVRVLQANHRGKENAVPHKALARYLDVSPRRLRKEVESLRREHGLPILPSYKGGYFWAETQEEVDEVAESLKRHGINIFVTRGALVRTGRRIFRGQLSLKLE